MTLKKKEKKEKKDMKVGDLKPRKDAKGGGKPIPPPQLGPMT
jgi:hypothetical protein